MDFRAEFFNTFDHPVFSGTQSGGFGSATGNLGLVNIANGSSAILSTANRPRIIQFAMKFNFSCGCPRIFELILPAPTVCRSRKDLDDSEKLLNRLLDSGSPD